MQITIPVHKPPRLTVRLEIGTGHCEGYEFGCSVTLPDHSIYITVDCKTYLIKASDVIEAVVQAHAKAKLDERPD